MKSTRSWLQHHLVFPNLSQDRARHFGMINISRHTNHVNKYTNPIPIKLGRCVKHKEKQNAVIYFTVKLMKDNVAQRKIARNVGVSSSTVQNLSLKGSENLSKLPNLSSIEETRSPQEELVVTHTHTAQLPRQVPTSKTTQAFIRAKKWKILD